MSLFEEKEKQFLALIDTLDTGLRDKCDSDIGRIFNKWALSMLLTLEKNFKCLLNEDFKRSLQLEAVDKDKLSQLREILCETERKLQVLLR